MNNKWKVALKFWKGRHENRAWKRKEREKKRTFMPNWMTSGHMHCASRKGGWDDSNTVAEGGVW